MIELARRGTLLQPLLLQRLPGARRPTEMPEDTRRDYVIGVGALSTHIVIQIRQSNTDGDGIAAGRRAGPRQAFTRII
jgi:hypothetical protein